MDWKQYLKSQGYTDQEIANMATTFGEEKMSKAFSQPIADKLAAEKALADAKTEKEEFETWYQTDVIPKLGQTYQDAINARTENAALKARLEAAKEYGFLSDSKVIEGVVPGSQPGQPVTAANPVPGSPAAPGASASPSPLDPRYVEAASFSKAVDSIPTMLGKLTRISNEHQVLFGKPLVEIDELISEAQASKGKRNVETIWKERFKVDEKRAEIQKAQQEAHDKEVAEAAVRKYATEHNHPFISPGVVSKAPLFAPNASADDARHPWKGARDRKQERRQTMVEAIQGLKRPSTGTGTVQ